MAKNNVSTKKWLLTNSFSIAAVIVAVANLWLLTKLAPIALHLNTLDNRVLANEVSVNDFGGELRYIRGRVDELYNFWIKP